MKDVLLLLFISDHNFHIMDLGFLWVSVCKGLVVFPLAFLFVG